MGWAFYLINVGISAGVVLLALVVWRTNRRRLGEDLIVHARVDAERIVEQAERQLADGRREADTLKKEALIEAKERTHELRLEAERHLGERREALARLEQEIVRRDAATAEQLQRPARVAHPVVVGGVVGAGLQEDDPARRLLAQPGGEHGPAGAAADDDDVGGHAVPLRLA